MLSRAHGDGVCALQALAGEDRLPDDLLALELQQGGWSASVNVFYRALNLPKEVQQWLSRIDS